MAAMSNNTAPIPAIVRIRFFLHFFLAMTLSTYYLFNLALKIIGVRILQLPVHSTFYFQLHGILLLMQKKEYARIMRTDFNCFRINITVPVSAYATTGVRF